MMRSAARMQRWVLCAMPVVALALCPGHTGSGGLALFLWVFLSPRKTRPSYPYPRKSRLHFYRLFFACSAGFCTLSLLFACFTRLPLPLLPAVPGISALATITCARCLNSPFGRTRSLLLGSLLFVIACM